ncbi:MASE1 domain-containing protein [Streptomyces sp. NBC_00893]|uniref:MASE1 domain-containing protein n=1 Tax=Streptomyces sp. NBC_00893 TaxID=2975862 RepID=UPI002258C9F4|nr:MASE1 domain-containing protein [Streptomyces sp. NBC_00893]MCX4844111.1 MASE1 domain-containing protein [Streptomyces sp. NBC_00893]
MDRARLRQHTVEVLTVLAVAACYYATARLGLLQQLVRGQVTPLWPPTGIAVAALLVFGVRIWSGIALGALGVNITIGPALLPVLIIAAGNTAAPVCSYLLLRRAGFRDELDRLRDALALVFLGALAGMLISATVGTGALVVSGALPAEEFWRTWSVWWTGDAMGVMVVTPFLLVVRNARLPYRISPARWAEAVALGVCTLGVTLLATDTSASLLFLVSPFLIWAAFRFERAGAASCALAVSTLAILAAGRMTGPFAHGLLTNMITLQAFNGTTALTALLLAAVVTERNRTYREIKRLCTQLSEKVTRQDL